MKKITICIVICLLNLPAAAIDYNDFPPALRQILDQRITEINSNRGICIAGIVTMSDGTHIGSGKDVKVNFDDSRDGPLWVYDGGWFIMNRSLPTIFRPEPAKLHLRAFGYEPIDASIAVLENQITYAEFEMQKTPAEKTGSIDGTIVNDFNEPLEGKLIFLSFPFSYRVDNGQPQKSRYIEPNGHYSFGGLTETEHHLWVPYSSYETGISFDATPAAGKTTTINRKMYRRMGVTLDYVYHSDVNRNFTEGNLKKGTIYWVANSKGMDFSEGKIQESESKSFPDLFMIQGENKLYFSAAPFSNGENGFYDAGDVEFESVSEASENNYAFESKPCIVGHTYVVKTYENNYAKFVVRSISPVQ